MEKASYIWVLVLAAVAVIAALVFKPYVTIPTTSPSPTPTPAPAPSTGTGGQAVPTGYAPSPSISSANSTSSVSSTTIQCINVYLNQWRGSMLYFDNISFVTMRGGVGQANATVIFYNTLPSYYFNSSLMYQFRPDPFDYPENFSQFLFENATNVTQLDQWGDNLSIAVEIPTWLSANDTLDNVLQSLYNYANDTILGMLYEPYIFNYFTVLPLPGYYGFSDEYAYTVVINPAVVNYTANSTDACLQLVNDTPYNVFEVLLFDPFTYYIALLTSNSSYMVAGDLLTEYSAPCSIINENQSGNKIYIPVNSSAGNVTITYSLVLGMNQTNWQECWPLQARIFNIFIRNDGGYNTSDLSNFGIYRIEADIYSPDGKINVTNITLYDSSIENLTTESIFYNISQGLLLNYYIYSQVSSNPNWNGTFFGYIVEPNITINLRIYANASVLALYNNSYVFDIGVYQADPRYLDGYWVNRTENLQGYDIWSTPIYRFVPLVTS